MSVDRPRSHKGTFAPVLPFNTLTSKKKSNAKKNMFSKFQKATDKARQLLLNQKGFHMAKKSKAQELFELCKTTFTPSGIPPPSSQAVQKICSLLDTFSPADVGLKEESADDDRGHGFFELNRLNRVARWAQPITFLDIHESESFTMCIFCFPTSSVIPLHDHPRMTVFSKVLYGSLHVKAYDWVEPPCIRENKAPGYPSVRLAKLAADKVLTAPCETAVLYPKSGGNLHSFTAVTPCAVLDVLTPPYKEDAGRRCSYYMDYPYSIFSAREGFEMINGDEDEHAWLSEIETPENLYMRSGTYRGPAVV